MPKCNWFIADGLRASGFKGSVTSQSGHVWGAHAWGDPKQTIPGMNIVADHKRLMPGDIIAVMHGSGGHVGIFAYGPDGTTPGVISANDENGVRWAAWPASDKSVGDNYVARRQEVDAPPPPPPPPPRAPQCLKDPGQGGCGG